LPLPVIFRGAAPDFFESCVDVAVIVSMPDAGALAGAV
jgi:hypothetical protein